MRALKFWTTTLLVFGLAMLMGIPVLLARRPPQSDPARERLKYAAFMTSYALAILLVFLIVMVLAYLLMRRQREEFQQERLSNLKDLVEGSLRDHAKKEQDEPD